MFGTMTLFLDVFTLILALNATYPSARDFFSTSCPFNETWTTISNNTVYTANSTAVVVAVGTNVIREIDKCARVGRVAFHVIMVVVVFLDILATALGWRML